MYIIIDIVSSCELKWKQSQEFLKLQFTFILSSESYIYVQLVNMLTKLLDVIKYFGIYTIFNNYFSSSIYWNERKESPTGSRKPIVWIVSIVPSKYLYFSKRKSLYSFIYPLASPEEPIVTLLATEKRFHTN